MLPAPLTAQDAADMAASFQMAVADAVADRCKRASRIFFEAHPEGLHLVVAGGVAANSALRSRLEKLAKEVGLELIAPPLKYCTDNAAMIAWAGIERLRLDQRDGMDFAPRPRWPLDPSAPKARFAGVKA
jgi:N6-L-threonylcarbamoyladenine synthase